MFKNNSAPNFSLTQAARPKTVKEGGSGGPPPENFAKLEAKSCILGTFGTKKKIGGESDLVGAAPVLTAHELPYA